MPNAREGAAVDAQSGGDMPNGGEEGAVAARSPAEGPGQKRMGRGVERGAREPTNESDEWGGSVQRALGHAAAERSPRLLLVGRGRCQVSKR